MDISIIIPAFNEQARIGLTLERSLAFLETRNWVYELLVVDDGSADATVKRVEAIAQGHKQVRCLRNGTNRGKGYSIRHGLEKASGCFVGFMDADYKTDIAALDAAMEHLQKGYHGVIGDRSVGGSRIAVPRRRYREWGSKTFRHLVLGVIGLKEFGDTQCGFKFFQAEVMRTLFAAQVAPGYMFDVEILLIAKGLGYRILPLPVEWQDDPDSRFKPFSGTMRNVGELARICWRHRG